jgi:hypothetical protein
MSRNQRIFAIIFIAFVLIVVLITIDMASRTTAPWNRRKQVERALPGQRGTPADALQIDTTGLDSVKQTPR